MSAVCRLLTTADAEAWKAALPTDVCVMGGLEYVRVEELHLGLSARLFVMECDGARIAYPFFLRPVPAHLLAPGTSLWDTATPEYTGPILLGAGTEGGLPPGLADFPQAFSRFCRAEGIVAEFAHLGPWAPRPGLLDPDCVEFNREIIYVDLTQDEKTLWHSSFSSDHRRQIGQSIKAGVLVRVAETAEDVLAFHRLHQETMDRREAKDHYYLSPQYFLSIFETMPDHALFCLAEYEDKVIAGGLYFQDATDIYWHLSAVNMDYSRVRPVNGYHYKMILLAMRTGRKRMICGGAHRANDGVLRFKAGFSPLRAQFQVYKRIHDAGTYAGLTGAWSRHFDGAPAEASYFPAYRAGAPDPEEPPPAAAGAPVQALNPNLDAIRS